MKRLLVICLLGFSSFSPRAAEVTTPVIDQALKSVYLLTGQAEEGGRYACTAWLLADETVMTANHCAKENADIRVSGMPATLIKGEEYFDLAAFKVVGLHGMALQVRPTDPVRFEELAALGQAYGWNRPMAMHVRVYYLNMSPDKKWAPGFLVKPRYIGGMSGGPVIDADGLVVGVVQASNADLGYGVGSTLIKAFLVDVI